MARLSESQLATIRDHPIEDALDSFRTAFESAHPRASPRAGLDRLQQLVTEPTRRSLVLKLIGTLQLHPTASNLPSHDEKGPLLSDLAMLYVRLSMNETDVKHTATLVRNVVGKEDDATIWTAVYDLIRQTKPTPSPIGSLPTTRPTTHSTHPTPLTPRSRSLPRSDQTPITYTTSGIVDSSEHRKYFDQVLKEELSTSLFVGVPNFFEAFFGEIEVVRHAAEIVFQQCSEGDDPLYEKDRGWRDWPKEAAQNDVLRWFTGLTDQLRTLAEEHCSVGSIQRRTLAQPDQPLGGSTAERKMDVGFTVGTEHGESRKCRWSQILVAGELKSSPSLDKSQLAWYDLARYAREIFTAQDARRFVLGFTLCGSVMRLWEFDRLGGIASVPFDINEDGLQFVSVILGYLLMTKEQLGFDPTILEFDGKRMVEIMHDNRTERLVLDGLIKRAPCVAGRATTCWRAYREGDESRSPRVVKDSWQYPERGEEGELLHDATAKGVVNVARHYHHETVRVADKEDDVYTNIRKDLDVTKATNYRRGGCMPPPSTSGSHRIARATGSASMAGRKRSSSQAGALEPSSKRACSSSPSNAMSQVPKNRVHRRVIIRDYGKPIYKASSRAALLAAMEGCIEGHESLHNQAGMLQRDVSANNLMINEDDHNPSWKAFLIDLDLAIREGREEVSGARGKTGTRAFMSIGVLLGEEHSFMHDLESFFWVLFWICIHYNGPDQGRVVPRFDKWNYMDTEELADSKKGIVADQGDFLKIAEEHFTPYYQPLILWVNRLRRKLFPNGGRWKEENAELYSEMKSMLRAVQEDPNVLADPESFESP